MCMTYGGEEELSVKGNVDASFQTDMYNFISEYGYVFMLNGGAMTWRTSKHETIANSTTYSEYIAANEATKEVVWIKKFIKDLGVVPSMAKIVEILRDN